MFTDSSKYKVIDDCLYEVECRVSLMSSVYQLNAIKLLLFCDFVDILFSPLLFINQRVTRKLGDVQLEGANPSAEEADEGTDEAVESGLDVVLNQRLSETPFQKSEYMTYLKSYVKA